MSLIPAQIEFDNQGRLVSTAFSDIYFQPEDSIAESRYVFLEHGRLDALIKTSGHQDITIAELGFGTGLNFLLTWEKWNASPNHQGWLHFVSFEKHPILESDLQKIHQYWPDLSDLSAQMIDQYPVLTHGHHRLIFSHNRVTLTLVFGDVIDTLPHVNFGHGVDLWYLDGFAPAKNPHMWDESLWDRIHQNTKKNGRITTFTAAGQVKRGLAKAGFEIEKVQGYGRKRDMLVGVKPATSPIKTQKTHKIAIIGAGIAGCAAAEALTRYGHHVTLIDQHPECAMGTSGNKVASVYPKLTAAPSPMDDFYRHAFSYTQNLYTQDAKSSFHPCGVLHLDRTDDAYKRHQKIINRALPTKLVTHLNQKQAQEASSLALHCGGLFYPKGGYISPKHLCTSLIKRSTDITLMFGHQVISFSRAQNKWTITTDKTSLHADILVLASGVFLHHANETQCIPTEIVRGQTTDWPGTAVSHALKTVLCHKGYLTPTYNGMHCLGATFDKGETMSSQDTPADHDRNMQQLFDEVPILQTPYTVTELSGRVGNRVATPDRLPVVGQIQDDLYVLGALGSHGFTTAPYCAEILASQINQHIVPIDVALLRYIDPLRFGRRA